MTHQVSDQPSLNTNPKVIFQQKSQKRNWENRRMKIRIKKRKRMTWRRMFQFHSTFPPLGIKTQFFLTLIYVLLTDNVLTHWFL